MWYLGVIIRFALIYHALGGISLFPPDAYICSITSFHGRGFLRVQANRTSPHNPLVMLEATVGLMIEVSFIATFTQRFFGK